MKLNQLFEGQGPAGWKKNYEARIDIDSSTSREMKNWGSLDTDKKKAAYKAAKAKFEEMQKAHETGLMFKTVAEAKEYLKTMEYPNWPMFIQDSKGRYVKYRGDKVDVGGVKDASLNDIVIKPLDSKWNFSGVEVTLPGVTTGPLLWVIKHVMSVAMDAKKDVYNKLGRQINPKSFSDWDKFKSNSVVIKCTEDEAEEFVIDAKKKYERDKQDEIEREQEEKEYAEKQKQDKLNAADAKKKRRDELIEKYGKRIAGMVFILDDQKEYSKKSWSVSILHQNNTRKVVADKLTKEEAEKKQIELFDKLDSVINSKDPAIKWCADNMMTTLPQQYLAIEKKNGKICSSQDLRFGSAKVKEQELPYPFGNVLSFNIGADNLTSIKNFPEEVNTLIINGAGKLTSLENIHKIVKKAKTVMIYSTGIKSNILGLLKIDGLKEIIHGNQSDKNAETALNIVAKYVGQGVSGLVKCQRELIEADLDDYAEE